MLSTGLAPMSGEALVQVRRLGTSAVNFLTDDPWNSAHRAPWFLRALPHYQHVFTPRHANEADLSAHGVQGVSYLPFAYAPEVHHPPKSLTAEDISRWSHRVAFIGGADDERLALVRILVKAGVPVALWGGYWREHPDLVPHAHGHADEETCRKIVAAAGANLCLVRRANRDGHSMRSYELPAIGGVLLVEDTADHRAMFGPDREAVCYFKTPPDLITQAGWLLALAPEVRARMTNAARGCVTALPETYASRLSTIRQSLSRQG